MVDLNGPKASGAISALDSSFADRIITVTGDVGEEATADLYVAAVMKKWGRLDISVQCAGINMKRAPLMDVPVEVLDQIWRINVRGGESGSHTRGRSVIQASEDSSIGTEDFLTEI